MAIITPYDNKIGIWHHQGQRVAARTIDEFAQALRRLAPAVTQVFVKTSDGSDWMSRYDNKAALHISGPDAIRRWVVTLQKYGLEFHAWCVPRGLDIEGEARVITQACSVPGVRSMVLDVEPYQGFYAGPRESVRPLMMRIHSALPGAYHIGMTVDPRSNHYAQIWPDEWFPFVNSVHLQLYWGTFGVSPETVLANGYRTWGGFGRPLFPLFGAHGVPAAEVERARQTAVSVHRVAGMSWWVLGQITTQEFEPINRHLDGAPGQQPPDMVGNAVTYGASRVVQPGDPGYVSGVFAGAEPNTGRFGAYPGYMGRPGNYHATNDHVANVWARWDPQIRQSGWYRIEAFVPNLHATAGRARYKLHGVGNIPGEIIISVPQAHYNNEWATLGTFYINAAAQQPGVVYLNDWTFEPGLELAFDALRWRPVVQPGALQVMSDVSGTAREIFQRGKALGNRANVFSRVGDSITASPYFLTPIGQAQFDLGAFRIELEPVVGHYLGENARAGNSFLNPSLAAGNGWGADRPLQPGYAYTQICGNEAPLVCEYKRVRPAVALIMIGTNDSGGVAPEVYTANLRRIVEISIEMGVIPVLSTIPPKLTDAWNAARVTEWNNIIRSMARQFEIPLWDYWHALQTLPNQGISSDGIHPSAPPDGFTAR
ncbi:MAG: hypothetical protein IT323_15385, partial [Anaerolineae bacterium]|nr:hypothetical protein [Anaerolineae bacterium]